MNRRRSPIFWHEALAGAHNDMWCPFRQEQENQWFIMLYEHNTKILYIYLGIFVPYLGMMPGLEALTWAHNDMMEPI